MDDFLGIVISVATSVIISSFVSGYMVIMATSDQEKTVKRLEKIEQQLEKEEKEKNLKEKIEQELIKQLNKKGK